MGNNNLDGKISISPFFEPDMKRYIQDMEFVVGALSRNEKPNPDILEWLFSKRKEKIFQNRYDIEKNIAAENLEHLTRRIVETIASYGSDKKQIKVTKGQKDIEFYIKDMGYFSIKRRVKDEESFWIKFAKEIKYAKIPRDYHALRIKCETEDAKEYRLKEGKKGEYYSIEELKNIREKSGKTKLEEYKERFDKGNLELMKAIVGILSKPSKEWDVMAFKPPYMPSPEIILESSDPEKKDTVIEYGIRVCSESFFDTKNNLLEVNLYKWQLEEKYFKELIKENDFIKVKKKLTEETTKFFDKFAENYQEIGINLADQAVVSTYKTQDGQDFNRITLRKNDVILDVFSTYNLPVEAITKHINTIMLKAQELEKGPYHYQVDDLLLELREIEPGWVSKKHMIIHNQEYGEQKFLDALIPEGIDLERSLPATQKYYIGKKKKKSGYESIHSLLKMNNTTVAEVQIRDPVMDYNSEVGIAKHSDYKKGRLDEVKKEFPEIARYCEAFFGKNEESDRLFDKIKMKHYAEKFKETIKEDVKKLFSEEDVFQLISLIKCCMDEEIKNSEWAKSEKEKEYSKYLCSEVTKETKYALDDHIENVGREFMHKKREIETVLTLIKDICREKSPESLNLDTDLIEKRLNMCHMFMLIDAYKETIESKDKNEKINEFILGEYILNMGSYNLISNDISKEKLERIKDIIRENKEKHYTKTEIKGKYFSANPNEKIVVEYVPKNMKVQDFNTYYQNRDQNLNKLGFDQLTTVYLSTVATDLIKNELLKGFKKHTGCKYKF